MKDNKFTSNINNKNKINIYIIEIVKRIIRLIIIIEWKKTKRKIKFLNIMEIMTKYNLFV